MLTLNEDSDILELIPSFLMLMKLDGFHDV